MSIRGHKSLGPGAAVFAFVGLCFVGLSASLEARVVITQQLQVLVKLAGITAQNGDPDSAFFANTGAGIRYNFLDSVPLPAGTTYVLRGLIYPAGTISLSQSDYGVSGNQVLNASNSIGQWRCVGSRLTDYSAASLPPSGTVLEEANFTFALRGLQSSDSSVYSKGWFVSGSNAPRSVLSSNHTVLGGTGSNEGADGVLSVELYVDSVLRNILMVITFDRPIQYYVP
jgi:hypothetical protein